MQKEADEEVWSHGPQHLRHQLQLVIVYPDRRSRRRRFGHGSCEAVVDRHVGVPPLPMERRAADGVVVQRPQSGVGEPKVELLELGAVEGHRAQLGPRVLLGHRRLVTAPRPTDPHTRPAGQHRREGRDQAAGAQVPAHLAVALHPAHRQPVGHHHQLAPPGPALASSPLPTRGTYPDSYHQELGMKAGPAVPHIRQRIIADMSRAPEGSLFALDYDGTLAPIASRPEHGRPARGAAEVLSALASKGATIALVTGRQATSLLRVSGLAKVPRLRIYALYGAQRWCDGKTASEPVGDEWDEVRSFLRTIVRPATGLWVEDKGLSLVVHARGVKGPGAALAELRPAIEAFVAPLGLEVHSGRRRRGDPVAGLRQGPSPAGTCWRRRRVRRTGGRR